MEQTATLERPQAEITPSFGWSRDLAAEGMFNRLGVQWEYRTGIMIALVDQGASLQNQARLGVSVMPDVVDDYAVAMREGDRFPAMVAFPLGNGTYRLAGGNHRLAAAKKSGRQVIDLYVVMASDDAMRRVVTTGLNRRVGVQTGREEAIEQALTWMDQYGRSATAAAAAYNLPESILFTAQRERASRRRLQMIGVDPSRMKKGAMALLTRLHSDRTLLSAVEFSASTGLREPEIRALVEDINAQRTESGQEAVLDQWRARDDLKLRALEVSKGRGRRDVSGGLAARDRFLRALRAASGQIKRAQTRGKLGLSADSDLETAITLARTMADTLTAMRSDVTVADA